MMGNNPVVFRSSASHVHFLLSSMFLALWILVMASPIVLAIFVGPSAQNWEDTASQLLAFGGGGWGLCWLLTLLFIGRTAEVDNREIVFRWLRITTKRIALNEISGVSVFVVGSHRFVLARHLGLIVRGKRQAIYWMDPTSCQEIEDCLVGLGIERQPAGISDIL